MLVSRITAAAAVLIGCSYPLSAQPAPKPQPIGMLLAVGDISSCGTENWTKAANATANVIRDAIKDVRTVNPSIQYRVLVLGDLAYGTGAAEEFQCFQERWTFDDANEIMLPVPGNHEYLNMKDGKLTDAAPYFDHFKTHPLVNQNGAKRGYYALNFPRADGPWRLIGLNDNFEYNKKYKQELADQAAWLENDLTANKQSCLLAFWHAPTFSSGQHGHVDYKDPKHDAALSKKRPMNTTFDLLYRHGASVILNGHEHNYEQFHPQDAKEKRLDDGIRLFVVGTGGKQLTADFYDKDKWEKNTEGGPFGVTRGTHGVLKILLYENRYEWEFLPIEKAVTKKVGKKTVTTMQKKKLDLATTSADCNQRK